MENLFNTKTKSVDILKNIQLDTKAIIEKDKLYKRFTTESNKSKEKIIETSGDVYDFIRSSWNSYELKYFTKAKFIRVYEDYMTFTDFMDRCIAMLGMDRERYQKAMALICEDVIKTVKENFNVELDALDIGLIYTSYHFVNSYLGMIFESDIKTWIEEYWTDVEILDKNIQWDFDYGIDITLELRDSNDKRVSLQCKGIDFKTKYYKESLRQYSLDKNEDAIRKGITDNVIYIFHKKGSIDIDNWCIDFRHGGKNGSDYRLIHIDNLYKTIKKDYLSY